MLKLLLKYFKFHGHIEGTPNIFLLHLLPLQNAYILISHFENPDVSVVLSFIAKRPLSQLYRIDWSSNMKI